jgi:hypothetical protein
MLEGTLGVKSMSKGERYAGKGNSGFAGRWQEL